MTTALELLTIVLTMPSFAATGAAQANLTSIPVDAGLAGQSISVAADYEIKTPNIDTPQPAERLNESRPWGVAAIYGWIPGIDGTITARNRTADVNLSVQDSIDKLLPDLKGAAMLHLEGGYGNVGVIFDLFYMNIEPSRGPVNVTSKTAMLETLGMYRVVDTGRGAGCFSFDVLAGARFYRFKNEIQLTALDITAVDRTSRWVDLVVGARGSFWLCEDLAIFGRADVGGFGIGQSSDQACNFITGLDYRCCDCVSLLAGYRWLTIDRTSGSGLRTSAIDITMHGPFMAVALQY